MLNPLSFVIWREVSEARISTLEKLVIDNIFQKGIYDSKNVLSQIVEWKIGNVLGDTQRKESIFWRNDLKTIESKVSNVLSSICSNPDEVSFCIKEFAGENKLKGVGIPVASTLLRFLDPIHHRYGIIDRYIAGYLNREGFTDFEFAGEYIANSDKNISEYERFHIFLRKKAIELENFSFTTTDGNEAQFSPVDVEMALFAYLTQNSQ
jgi:hypothetical protein